MKILYAWQPFPKQGGQGYSLFQKTVLMFKITTFLLCVGMVSVYAETYSQHISVAIEKGPLTELFKEIQEQSDYVFFYQDKLVAHKTVSVSARNENIQRILKKVLAKEDLDYVISGKQITIKAR